MRQVKKVGSCNIDDRTFSVSAAPAVRLQVPVPAFLAVRPQVPVSALLAVWVQVPVALAVRPQVLVQFPAPPVGWSVPA